MIVISGRLDLTCWYQYINRRQRKTHCVYGIKKKRIRLILKTAPQNAAFDEWIADGCVDKVRTDGCLFDGTSVNILHAFIRYACID